MIVRTLLWAVICGAASGQPAPAERIVRVPLPRPGDLATLKRHGFDVVTVHPVHLEGGERAPPAADLVVERSDVARLAALGFRVFPASPPADEAGSGAQDGPIAFAAAATLPPGYGQGGLGGAYTLAEIDQLLDHYAATAPGIVSQKFVVGTSVEGRKIHAVRVSDHPGVDEGEPRVLLEALHHAREPMSAHCLLVLLEHIVSRYGVDADLTSLVDGRDVWIVPVVNPDGYVFNEAQSPGGGGLWRKNRRPLAGGCVGVDLNRNYAFQWGIDDVGSSPDPCAADHRGPHPLSEPESAALAGLAAVESFDVVGSLHAHGRLFLRPFGVPAAPSPRQALYLAHGARLAATNGYRAGDVLSLLGPANGNALDHHEAFSGAEAWGLEVGSSFWPSPAEMVDVALENVEPLLFLVRFAGSFVEPVGLTVLDPAGDGDGHADPGETVDVIVRLKNLGQDVASGATVVAAVADPSIGVLSALGTAGALPSLAEAGAVGVRLSMDPSAPPGSTIPLEVRVLAGGLVVTRVVPLDVGTPRAIGRDDFETAKGWTAGLPTDTATSGRWVLADPVGVWQGADLAQPEDDHTPSPGKRCFVTGNQGAVAGQDDVDDGFTTLVSPRFDLSAAVRPRLRYTRFTWCSKADDPFRVEVSSDDGATWAPLEVTFLGANAWTPVELPLDGVVPLSDSMRFKFVAEDGAYVSVTEALVDDFELIDYGDAPHLLLVGRPVGGGAVELAAAARPGERVLVLAGATPSSTGVPGFAGSLAIAPASASILADVVAPADGLLRLPAIVPSAAALTGQTVLCQAAALDPSGGGAFSNVVAVTIE